jgi:hypothetical protein
MTTQVVEAAPVGPTVTRSIRALCGYHGIYPTELGAHIGVSRSSWNRHMKAGRYTAEEIAAIAAMFGITTDDLLRGDLRLSRERTDAGQEPFSGSDIDALLDAVEQQHHAAVA